MPKNDPIANSRPSGDQAVVCSPPLPHFASWVTAWMLFTERASEPAGGVIEGISVGVAVKVEVGIAVRDGSEVSVLVGIRVEVANGLIGAVSAVVGEIVSVLANESRSVF